MVTPLRKIRVLIVDDSITVRKALTEALSREADIEVVGTAPDPYVARDKIVELEPDVITLDIEMPRMDGISFLKKLMQYKPMPVIIISSVASGGAGAAVRAMEAGAVEVLAKPAGPYSAADVTVGLGNKIRAAARARIAAGTVASAQSNLKEEEQRRAGLVLIGASTGGTEAIRAVLENAPLNCPPIVVVQHIPPVFSRAFADRLNQLCRIQVKEAVSGDVLVAGQALIAPGDMHILLRRSRGGYHVELTRGPRVSYQRPAVDVLFHSTAELKPQNAVAVLLTGMGNDGAAGMLALRRTHVHTIAQDEATSVVYGMPRAAASLGAVDEILPLHRIASRISRTVHWAA